MVLAPRSARRQYRSAIAAREPATSPDRSVREELLQLRPRLASRAAHRTTSHKPLAGHSFAGFSFLVRLERKDGKFGMGHDEHNCVVLVRPGSAADDVGLRVGDAVRSIDGKPLAGLLNNALQNKECVQLQLLRKAQEPLAWCDLRALEQEVKSKVRA